MTPERIAAAIALFGPRDADDIQRVKGLPQRAADAMKQRRTPP
jgi:hypothetical protein